MCGGVREHLAGRPLGLVGRGDRKQFLRAAHAFGDLFHA